MAAPLTFDIPHSLGKEEAKRRIIAGLPKMAKHIPGGGEVDSSWTTPDHLAMTITAMKQKVGVELEVEESVIRARVAIPMMLSMMGGPIAEFVKTSAHKMLAAPKSE